MSGSSHLMYSGIYREVLHTVNPGQWGMQGAPGILQDPHNVFKGIKLGQQDKDKACYIRFFFYRSFSAP